MDKVTAMSQHRTENLKVCINNIHRELVNCSMEFIGLTHIICV